MSAPATPHPPARRDSSSYHRARAAQELELAKRAACAASRQAHLELAAAHRQAQRDAGHTQPVSDPQAMSRFGQQLRLFAHPRHDPLPREDA